MTRPKLLMLLHCLNEEIPLILQWAVPMLLVYYKGKELWICKHFLLHCSRHNTSQTLSEKHLAVLLGLWSTLVRHSLALVVVSGKSPHCCAAQGTLPVKWWGNKHRKMLLQDILATKELNSIDPQIKIMLASFTLACGCYFFFFQFYT